MGVPINQQALNLQSMVLLDLQHSSSAYERFQRHECIIAPQFSLRFHWTDLSPTGSGKRGPFPHPKYGLLFNGTELATYRRLGVEVFGTFTGPTPADGDYLTEIVAYDAAGNRVQDAVTLCKFGLWCDKGGTAGANQTHAWIQNGSFDWTHAADGPIYFWMRVPLTALKTRAVPQRFKNIPSVETGINVPFPGKFPGGEPFNKMIPFTQIKRIDWAPTTDDDCLIEHRPARTKRGIVVTENMQGYFADDTTGKVPNQALLDGPRGVATCYSPTAFWPGHSGNMYVSEPYATSRFDNDGVKRTIHGMRHVGTFQPYWEDMGNVQGRSIMQDQTKVPGVEYVGNWDPSIPLPKRFAWESWGMVFYNTDLDMSLPTAERPPYGQLPQHAGIGPVMFQTCRFGRILKTQFDKTHQDDPPTITEHVTGLSDPWGLAISGNVLYVAERGRSRISMWDADTPQTLLGVLKENTNGANFGAVPATGKRMFTFKPAYLLANGNPNYDKVRQECSILSPEGLDISGRGLFFGDFGTAQVMRIDLDTRAETVCCRPYISYQVQSHWMNVAVSDGTFGPLDTVFTDTFDNQTAGRPRAWPPGNAVVAPDGVTLTHGKEWAWQSNAYHRNVGRGATAPQVYASGMRVKNGMMVCGSSGPGFAVFTQAAATDPTPDAVRMKAGYQYYNAHGYRNKFGNYGFGHVDEPLPWGENADQDYWFTYHGHVAAQPPVVDCSAVQAELDAILAKIEKLKAALA